MSTKIYNGYVLPKQSMEELLVFCKDMGNRMKEKKQNIIIKTLATMIIHMLDSTSAGLADKVKLGEKALGKSLYGNALESLRSRIDKRNKFERDPQFDFGCNIMLFPMEDKVLCLLYCEHSELEKIWNENVQEYHYQNQTDKPDEISNEEWEQRRKDWNEALGGDGWGRPIDNGFKFTFTDEEVSYPYPVIEEVIAELPSFEERLAEISKEKYVSDYIKSKTKEKSKQEQDDQLLEVWRHYTEAVTRLRQTEEGKQELAELSENLQPLLVPNKEITREFLLEDYFPKEVFES